MTILGDYHIHTPFCPHGTNDSLGSYAEKAIKLGLEEISFTEHAPLPEGFTDPAPNQDSSMSTSQVEDYIEAVQLVKEKYKGTLKINMGFEVDYIEGFEKEIEHFLTKYGDVIDDAILSVHMIKDPNGNYHCLDFSSNTFGELVNVFGSLEAVYQAYFSTVEKSVVSDLGPFKPNRIGHMTLVEKFKRVYPYTYSQSIIDQVNRLLDQIKANNLSLDVNTAGLFKPNCLTIYPNPSILDLAKEKQISLKLGSDAHQAKDIGRAFEIGLLT